MNSLDLLCFFLSGLSLDGTITVEMDMVMGEFFEAGYIMDLPKGGSKAFTSLFYLGLKKG